MALLEIENMSKQSGGLKAVDQVNLKVEKNEIFGLIGPNGAGKSTSLNMIDGSLPLSSGQIFFREENITNLPAYKRAGQGIARVFQKDVLFSSFSVIDNVIIGGHLQTHYRVRDLIFPWGRKFREKERKLQAEAMEILDLVELGDLSNANATNLPHGNQRALGLAIAMATNAEMLLLDEPLTGMNGEETAKMMELIKLLREQKGKTIMIVEHNVKAIIGLCDRVAVLDYGSKIAEGSPRDVIKNPRVVEAYLGADSDVA